MTKITRIEKQPADFDRPADRYTFKVYGPHHIPHKGEKLIATIKMNVGDLSLNECDNLPVLFSKAPQMQACIEAQAAEIEQWRVDYDCAVMDVERLREAGTKVAGFADHDFGCLHYERNDSCDCGYTQAWKAWSAALGETE